MIERATRAQQIRRGGVVALCVLLDLVTKEWALRDLGDGSTISILPTVEFDLSFNSGFSFGTGAGSGRLIGLVVIAMVIYLSYLSAREPTTRRGLLLAVILGGAIGNLIDRIFRADDGWLTGEVVDFVDVSWFAVFNVADTFVVCGVIVLIASELFAPITVAVTDADAGTDPHADTPSEDPAESAGSTEPPTTP